MVYCVGWRAFIFIEQQLASLAHVPREQAARRSSHRADGGIAAGVKFSGQLQVRQDLFDDYRLLDQRDQAPLAAALALQQQCSVAHLRCDTFQQAFIAAAQLRRPLVALLLGSWLRRWVVRPSGAVAAGAFTLIGSLRRRGAAAPALTT